MIDPEIRGLEETRKAMLEKAEKIHGAPMISAMRDATLIVTRDAKIGTPVDSGRLRASITPDVRLSGKDLQGVVGSNVVYAPFVELGTRPHWPPLAALETWAARHGTTAYAVAKGIAAHGTRPVKMLQNALEKNKSEIINKLERGVAGIVKD